MASYVNSKPGIGSIYPENAIESPYQRLEPIIGFDELTDRYLFGLPLISQMKNPLTQKSVMMGPDQVKDIIDSAIQTVELDAKIDIFPVKRDEKYPFDRNLYNAFGYMRLRHRPITGID